MEPDEPGCNYIRIRWLTADHFHAESLKWHSLAWTVCCKPTQRPNGKSIGRRATQFTIFKFLEVDENLLSDMLAFLLDPAEAYGQQEQFLQLFVRRLGRTHGALIRQAHVAREALTYSISKQLRRIDVLVTAPGLVIAIENKVDAGEGD